jgi:hypothetical protein
LEQGSVPIFISDIVSLEDHAALQFSAGSTNRRFAALLNADVKDHANMSFGTFASGLSP